MSRFSGPQGKGARRAVREKKRKEAELRQAEFDEALAAHRNGAEPTHAQRKNFSHARYVARLNADN